MWLEGARLDQEPERGESAGCRGLPHNSSSIVDEVGSFPVKRRRERPAMEIAGSASAQLDGGTLGAEEPRI